MRDYLDPDHWVNGGEKEFFRVFEDAQAMAQGVNVKLNKTIGITGLAGAGKTYAATWFKLRTGGEIWSFAAEIKRIAGTMGWNGEKDARGRKLLQDLGSIGREYNRQCWVNRMPTDRPVIIDDVRFVNEAAAIRSVGGIIIRIERPGLTPMDHLSETEQAHITPDYTVANNRNLEECLEYIHERESRPA